jgi:AcrR family transcriptional regulator
MQKRVKTDVRTRLIQAAVNLAHRRGFEHTTLVEIARAAKVPPGNLYYYFKTKGEIADAIVEQRLSELSAVQQELGRIQDPRERLCSLVRLRRINLETVSKYGCPVGTFCSELNKDGSQPAKNASKIFSNFLDWIEAQFQEFCSKAEARGHAVHLISVLQGVTVLASCTKNPDFIVMETNRIENWIRTL